MRHLLALALAVVAAAPALAQDKPAAKAPTAVMTLENGGVITLEFFPADAPKHVENFLKLARAGFYDGQRFHRVEPGFVVALGDSHAKTPASVAFYAGQRFHRVEPGFVVQLGDPQSKTLAMDHSSMGSGGPGYTIKAEFNNRKFERGVLGMARK